MRKSRRTRLVLGFRQRLFNFPWQFSLVRARFIVLDETRIIVAECDSPAQCLLKAAYP